MKINNYDGSDSTAFLPSVPSVPSAPTVTIDVTDLKQCSGHLEERLRGLLSTAQELGRKTLQTYWEIGEVLIDLKAKIAHGNWEDYVKKTFEMSPKTASNYARLVKGYGTIESLEETFKGKNLGEFGLVKALELLKSANAEPSQYSDEEDEPAFILADGSSMAHKKIGWKEGVIQTERLQATMEACEKDEHGKPVPENEAVLIQRAVSLLAAAVNKAVGRVRTEKSQKIALDALELVKTKLVHAGE